MASKTPEELRPKWYEAVRGRFTTRMAEQMRRLMEVQGWSQARLARALGVHEVTLSRWMQGHHAPGDPVVVERLRELVVKARQGAGPGGTQA